MVCKEKAFYLFMCLANPRTVVLTSFLYRKRIFMGLSVCNVSSSWRCLCVWIFRLDLNLIPMKLSEKLFNLDCKKSRKLLDQNNWSFIRRVTSDTRASPCFLVTKALNRFLNLLDFQTTHNVTKQSLGHQK